MAQYSDMIPDCRAGLPAAPDFLVQNALARAGFELCRQSHVWMQTLDPITTQVGVTQYDLDPPSGAYVERVLWVQFNGIPIGTQMREQDLLAQPLVTGPPAAPISVTGTPLAYCTSNSSQSLTIYPIPKDPIADVGNLICYAVLVPLPTATTIPDDIANQYRNGIIALARADVMVRSPGMPWHNPKEAAMQDAIGQDWILRAKRKQASGGHVPLRAQPRRFII